MGTKLSALVEDVIIYYQDAKIVRYHIAKHGFVHDYQIWRFQGETSIPLVEEDTNQDINESSSMYRTMVIDAAGHEFNFDDLEEPPNPEAKKFFDMVDQNLVSNMLKSWLQREESKQRTVFMMLFGTCTKWKMEAILM